MDASLGGRHRRLGPAQVLRYPALREQLYFFAWTVAGNHDLDSPRSVTTLIDAAQHVCIGGQHLPQHRIHRSSIRFDIEQQHYRGAVPIDAATVFHHSLAERIQVEILQRLPGAKIWSVMTDQQFSIHEVDVGFDAAKAMLQSILQRPLMAIIVMRMRSGQGDDRLAGLARRWGSSQH